MSNSINSIAGIDDFADEMKKNLENLRQSKLDCLEFHKKYCDLVRLNTELKQKYEKALAFIKDISERDVEWFDHDTIFDAQKLLKELGE